MDQLTQNKKSGKMEILDVPFPALAAGKILVRTNYSVISAGTEGSAVRDARRGYIGKARARQKEVKQIIDSVMDQGLSKTYKRVMNKLDAQSSLGYSCAGEVVDVGAGVDGFQIGDRVACGGGDAAHAEVVSVPTNLCARIPEDVDFKHAAFAIIASIAMQGIRRADLRLGENCVVIGLGLIGQLTMQMLNAAGILSVGIDIDERQVELAKVCGACLALERSRPDLAEIINNFTQGHGADAVIITAGTNSLDPVELAGALCRKKGKVVVVGAVPTGFSRPNYYKKELDLRMSCSYGPGRYDAQYEEKGIDYPIGYVRWTENRNMQAYLQLLKDKKLDIENLITHEFDFKKAPEAYQMILNKNEHFCGIVLKYDHEKPIEKTVAFNEVENYAANEPNVGFIGAGSFAQNSLLPVVKKYANMIGVATAHGNTAVNIARKYGFGFATGDADEIIQNENINTIFIATRHDFHAEYVLKALQNRKNVFVEKPLCLTEEELEEIKLATDPRRLTQTFFSADSAEEKQSSPMGNKASSGDSSSLSSNHLNLATSPRLMLGFNRRFAPHIQQIAKLLTKAAPKAINYRINAGAVPVDHWVHDKDVGGGRIIGEVCHFVDLVMFLAGAKITAISANVMQEPNNLLDTVVINLSFNNGSIANISYFSNGNKKLEKEYLEVFSNGQVAIIDDFKKLKIYSNKVSQSKLSSQDKGHFEEVKQFLQCIKEGRPSPISFEDIYLSSLATFKILESIKTNKTISLTG